MGLIRRARDKRHTLDFTADGLTMISRGFAENIAHAIMLALETLLHLPDKSTISAMETRCLISSG
ncbi:MAG: hypothetical protein R3E67_06820 [Pseudomonadales bacterium]